LPDQCRTVFKLIKEDGFRYKEVAEILGLSPRTVETQLFRAIKKLQSVVDLYIQSPGRKQRKTPPATTGLVFIPIIPLFF
jgi:RNA polymerase sigma-70 factor (ECF subfamily)